MQCRHFQSCHAHRHAGPAGRLLDFVANQDVDLPVSAMGIGRLGGISRRELMRHGSVLNYAHLGRARIAGQPSLREIRRWTLSVETSNVCFSMKLPDQVPVMPLPGAVLFPHALLPLYIFEPRYREMLEHALSHHRMFCVTLIKPSCPEWHASEDFFHLASVGLIRACVGRGRWHFQFDSARFAARPFH